MDRFTRWGLSGLICASVFIAFIGGVSALDHRFELNTRELDKKRGSVAERKRRLPGRRPLPLKSSTPLSASTAETESLYRLPPLTVAASDRAAMITLRTLWKRLVPGLEPEGALELRAESFTLSLDPQALPVLPAADGGKIIIDANRALSPPIISLIQKQEPFSRVISEHPSSGDRFYAKLLKAGGFYSVEPEFPLEFGDDPRLSLRAEYRIERTADSLFNNDTVLLYTAAGRLPLPRSLTVFLAGAGFRVVEPGLPGQAPLPPRDRFVQILPGDRFQVADALLRTLGVVTNAGASMEFTGLLPQGVALTVRVERAFVYNGRRYALVPADAGQLASSLRGVLESQGVTVVLLAKEDDFRIVTGKLLQALSLPVRFDRYRLWPLGESPYTVEMSGFLLRDPATGHDLFLTDRAVTPLLLDIIAGHGYAVTGATLQRL